MGDRATFQIITSREFSPIGYVHWAGSAMPAIIQEAAPYMRAGDVSYAFARLCGFVHNRTGGDGEALSFGVYNADSIQLSDTCGDNGHFLINLETGVVSNIGWEGETEVIFTDLQFYRG